ncbi:MAG: cob(I)yrinic acid a,c-diamide adenosyltransferase [Alphaproteobacteria bacterium]
MTDTKDELNRRANEKARKRKAAHDKKVAAKTVEKGLLIVHTGTGKGKSTAAFGLALRALGNGMRVGVVQFVKGAWTTGERPILEGFGEQLDMRVVGEGFTWETQDRARDVAAAEAGWAAAQEMIEASRGDAPRYDMEVVAALRGRPPDLHVVVTGRNAKPELIEAADLVTEMTLIKHPFREQGVKAQKGIEF